MGKLSEILQSLTGRTSSSSKDPVKEQQSSALATDCVECKLTRIFASGVLTAGTLIEARRAHQTTSGKTLLLFRGILLSIAAGIYQDC